MKRSMFTGRQNGIIMGSPVSAVLENLQNEKNARGAFVTGSVAAAGISMEGLSDQRVQMELQTAVENLETMVQNSVKGIKGYANLTVAQEEAAISAGVAAYAIKPYMSRDVSAAALAKFSNENTTVIGHGMATGQSDQRSIDMQAFDEKENKNAMVYSVAYNMQAARQDEFGEAFYPTVIVTPNNVGFNMSIRLMYVYDEVRRDLSGSLNKFNRKNVIKAVIDATILRNDQTKIVPVYRKSEPAAAQDSDRFFSADVGTTSMMVDGQPVTTGALAVGKKFSLLGISQTEALLSTGVQDQTDAIDSSVRLASIYLKLKGTVAGAPVVNVVKFNVEKLPLSDFNAAPQGNTRLLQLNFSSDSLYLTKNNLGVDGAPATLLANLGTNTVRLSAQLFGSVLQDKGDTQVTAGPIEVAKVTDDSGNVLDTQSGVGKTVASVFDEAEIVGYDLLAYRTNSNRRQRGQLIDTQYMNYLYTVPLLPPITALRPVGETETNDSALLSALITTTHGRTSNAAVTALLEARSFLREYTNTKDSINDAPEILGVARYLVTPAYLEETLDCVTNLDSLSSSDRTVDLQNLIQNKLRDMAFRLYVSSGYKAAADALYDGAAPKPCLIIGTDPILSRYLTLNGDLRLVGETIDYKLVSTLDSRMAGKIIFSFGMEPSFNSGVPNPMHFGNMAWKPELTLMMPMIRNGSNVMELTVQPSFRHVTNLPIMGSLDVLNIETVIASKVNVHVSGAALVP